MRSNEIMVLQAFLLYLLSLGRNIDPRSLFCLIGIAVRMATRLGLHRDGAQLGLSLFETEQRRRLWWQLVALDKRMAEMTGSAIMALSSSGADCRFPLNVNDTDLHPHAKDPPRPYTGQTEMLFCLTRIELTRFAATRESIRPNSSIVKDLHMLPSPPTTLPGTGTREASGSTLHGLDSYCSFIESTYLKHFDPKIPIQLFTLMATRASICKLRVIDFMCRRIPASDLDKRERDALFLCAIQMLEYDDAIFITESLRGFLRYSQLQGPLPGYIFLASELRHRTAGDLCERAWKAICNNYDHRNLVRSIRNPMHAPFGHAIIKAWNAREQAELQLGRTIEPPHLVILMRQHLSSKTTASRTAPDPAHAKDSATGSEHGPADAAADPTAESRMPSQPEGMDQTLQTILEDKVMLPSLDSTSQIEMDGGPWLDYDQTDWTYLMQSAALDGVFQHPL